MHVNIVAIIFIVVHSAIDYEIFKYDVYLELDSDSWIWLFVSYLWIITYFLVFAFYAGASFTNPGYLTFAWIGEAQRCPDFKEELDENGEKCFCEMCNFPRPLRAHHCSVCKKCVLLMDHHCDFIGNCVGYRNFKQFFVFLWIFPVHAIAAIAHVIHGVVRSDASTADIVVCVFGLIYFAPVTVLVVTQLVPQVHFALRNTTWIESQRDKVREAIYQRAKVKYVNRYDVGVWNNLKVRMGQNPLMWLLPTPNYDNPYVLPKNPNYVPIHELQYDTLLPGEDLADSLMPIARLRELNQVV